MSVGVLRFYVLKLISKSGSPVSGYALMKRIEEETGFWRPSPGSIYPLLASLEEDGLVEYRKDKDRKLYLLTEAGRDALDRAQQAKEEAMRGVRRSIHVFGELFGSSASDELERFVEAASRGVADPRLSRSLGRLRMLLHTILMRCPSEREAEEIAVVVDRAVEELKGYVEGD